MAVARVQTLPLDLFSTKPTARLSPGAGTAPRPSPSSPPGPRRERRAPSPLRIPCGLASVSKSPLASGTFHLAPSVGATPRTSLPSEGCSPLSPFSGSFSPISTSPVLRPGQIIVPSRRDDNDAARVRSGGQRMNLSGAVQGLRRYSSEPALNKGLQLLAKGSSEGFLSQTSPLFGTASPKTPRTQRGAVRKASKVGLCYPGFSVPLPPPPPVVPRAISSPPSRPATSATSGPASPNNARKRVVCFEDERRFERAAQPTSRGDAAVREAGLKRSKQLMGSLYDLRRVGTRADAVEDGLEAVTPAGGGGGGGGVEAAVLVEGETTASNDTGVAAGAPAKEDDGTKAAEEPRSKDAAKSEDVKDEPLFYSTLGDVADSEAQLRRTEKILADVHEPVHEYGGSRHATAVVSHRTLAVIRRKAHLLHECEGRLALLVAAHERKEDVLRMLKADAEPDVADLVKVNKFLQAHIHKGNPAEANKSDFISFVNSFGLPEKHQAVSRIHEFASAAVDWWARAALREAEAGTDTAAVGRMLDLAAEILGDKAHPNIVACREVLGNILAQNALKSATQIQEKDAARVASSTKPQPESAKKSYDAINLEIKTAVAMGAQAKHDALKQAKSIAISLERAEKDRLAQSVLLFAKDLVAKDEAAAAKATGVPPVGPASAAADRVEQEVRMVIKERGVPEDHPTLKEAVIVGKALRDKDGERKRLVAREKRLAASNNT